MPRVFKIGSYIMQTIEARSKDVLDLWYAIFHQISYYC